VPSAPPFLEPKHMNLGSPCFILLSPIGKLCTDKCPIGPELQC
jgi:hypothetical protein